MASSFITSSKARMRLPLPKKAVKIANKKKSSGGGVMGKQETKRKRTIKKKTSSEKPSASKKNRRSSNPKPDMIVLLEESDDDYDTVSNERKVTPRKIASRNPTETPFDGETVEDVDDDSEFEFEG
jgi:hypothetical protein